MKITVKVTTRARKTEIIGFQDTILHVRLKAVPEKGQANKELIHFLSKILKIPQSNITITYGHTSSIKHLSITGLVKEIGEYLQVGVSRKY